MAATLDPEHIETRVTRELIDFAGKDVLEIGCGDGRLTWRYAYRARSVLALDVDACAIDCARQWPSGVMRRTVRFDVADITQAKLPASAFDVAMFSWSL